MGSRVVILALIGYKGLTGVRQRPTVLVVSRAARCRRVHRPNQSTDFRLKGGAVVTAEREATAVGRTAAQNLGPTFSDLKVAATFRLCLALVPGVTRPAIERTHVVRVVPDYGRSLPLPASFSARAQGPSGLPSDATTERIRQPRGSKPTPRAMYLATSSAWTSLTPAPVHHGWPRVASSHAPVPRGAGSRRAGSRVASSLRPTS